MKKRVLTHLEEIEKNDVVLLLGVPLFLNDVLSNRLKESGAAIIYMHPIDYKTPTLNVSKFIKYEVGSEEGICALLLHYFAQDNNAHIQAFIEDLDMGYLSAESSIGEEELEEMVQQCNTAKNSYLMVSEDFLGHEKAQNIITMLGVLNANSSLKLVIENGSSKAIEAINECSNSNVIPHEVETLGSFNGAVICKNSAIEPHQLLGGVSFSKLAKIEDGDEVVIAFENQKIKRKFKTHSQLQGTVALCSVEGIESLAYSYKQVKIEKVEE